MTQPLATSCLKLAALSFAFACTTAKPPSDPKPSAPTHAAEVARAAGTSATALPTRPAVATVASGEPSVDVSPVNSTASSTTASSSHRLVIEAPYWATPHVVVDKMLELAKLQPTDVVYDLGCGDARSLVTAAQRYGARGIGFDIDSRRVSESRENARRHGVENLVEIALRDIFFVDLSNADVIFLFMLERLNARLIPQLEKLRPGARIVAHEFPIPGIKPDRVVRVMGPPDGPPDAQGPATPRQHVLYLWKMPWRKSAT